MNAEQIQRSKDADVRAIEFATVYRDEGLTYVALGRRYGVNFSRARALVQKGLKLMKAQTL